MQYNKNIPGRILWHLFVHRGIWGIYSLNLLHNQSKICKLRSWSRSASNDISIMNISHFLEQLVLVFFSYSLGWICFVSWFNFSMSICFKRLQKYVWWSHETTATLAGWKRWLDSINFSKCRHGRLTWEWNTHKWRYK